MPRRPVCRTNNTTQQRKKSEVSEILMVTRCRWPFFVINSYFGLLILMYVIKWNTTKSESLFHLITWESVSYSKIGIDREKRRTASCSAWKIHRKSTIKISETSLFSFVDLCNVFDERAIIWSEERSLNTIRSHVRLALSSDRAIARPSNLILICTWSLSDWWWWLQIASFVLHTAVFWFRKNLSDVMFICLPLGWI